MLYRLTHYGAVSCFIFLLLSTVIGCSTVDTQAEYTSTVGRSTSDLTVPPGLNSPDVSNGLKLLPNDTAVPGGYRLDKINDMQIIEGGSQRILLVKGKKANDVWSMVIAYLSQSGLTIEYQNQAVGLIQTDWAVHNNVVHETDIRGFFDWVGWGNQYSLKSQIKFRINLFQNESGVEVFVTNYEMNEVYPGCAKYLNQTAKVYSTDTQVPIWMPIPPNPQIELEFLAKFMVFAGTNPVQVKQQVASLATNESANAQAVLQGTNLIIYDTFDRAWWRTELALSRVGLGVTDKNRSNGEYYVYPLQAQIDNSDPGVIARWFRDDKSNLQLPKSKYIVRLVNANAQQVILTLTPSGTPDKTFAKDQMAYLENLLKQLK